MNIKSSLLQDLKDIEKFEEGLQESIENAVELVREAQTILKGTVTSERKSVKAYINRRTKKLQGLLQRTVRDLIKPLDEEEEEEESTEE